MAQNTIDDLRNHLFAQLEDLRDPEKKLDEELKRAEKVSEIAHTIIAAAKVEIQAAETFGADKPSTFFPDRVLGDGRPNGKALRQ